MLYKKDTKLDEQYCTQDIEDRCISFWDTQKTYKYNQKASRDNSFIIDTPPPTVSGSLHVGHIFSFTQTDVIARYQRMKGKSVFYPIGWDDNGLPTERRVQNYYNITCNPKLHYNPNFTPVHNPDAEGPKQEVSRKNFIEACELLTAEDEGIFEDVFKRIGHSYDWSLKYTTISPESIKISQQSFLDLYNDGKAQSVEAPIMWDVTFKSAISQAEVEDKEVDGNFYNIKFNVEGTDSSFIIATTRPELLGACLAIVANPEDDRFKPLFGKKAIVPLFDIAVPILASEHADKEKGTGIMMVCTFGDSADVTWWKQSGLPAKPIIGLDGRMLDVDYGSGVYSSLSPQKAKQNYQQIVGLTTKQAKEKIVAMLKEEGFLQGEPQKITHLVKFYEKGNLPLEFVTSRQWFIKLMDEKQKLIEAGRKINWQPSHMQNRFESWTEGLNQDWCISRQRFFGVPFPIWYKLDKDAQPDYNSPIFPSSAQLPIDPMSDVPTGYTEAQRGVSGGFIGNEDVMDTWATSSLTPQIAMSRAPQCSSISLPFDIRPQAHDIIRTWAFYTIAKSLMHENTIPWKEALISGFILDPDRKKMSKSKGNVVTPMNLIEKYSADGVRYWASKARLGADTAFDEKMMQQGRKLVVKMYNASKFVFNILEGSGVANIADYNKNITSPLDKSWMTKVTRVVEESTKSFERNDYAQALDNIESCFWDFCDNYVEIVKKRAYSEDNKSAVASLKKSLDVFVRLMSPFCPFICEEIYQARPWKQSDTNSVHLEPWPTAQEFADTNDCQSTLYEIISMISSDLRKAKTIENKSQKTPITGVEIEAPDDILTLIKEAQTDLENVGSIVEEALEYKSANELCVKNITLDMGFVQVKNNA